MTWAKQFFAKILLELWTKVLKTSLIKPQNFSWTCGEFLFVNSTMLITSVTLGPPWTSRSLSALLLKGLYIHSHGSALLPQRPSYSPLFHTFLWKPASLPAYLYLGHSYFLALAEASPSLHVVTIYSYVPGIVLIPAWGVPALEKLGLVLKTGRWENAASL